MAIELSVAMTREDAIRAFCEAEYPALTRYCLRLTGDEQAARDVAQEAFVRLFTRWVAVREHRGYLYLVATNVARRQWRRQRTERQAVASAYERPHDVGAPDLDVRDAVDRLPRRWRDVVLLHYYADLPVAEVAALLGLPEGSVKRTLSEARALLARSLGGPR